MVEIQYNIISHGMTVTQNKSDFLTICWFSLKSVHPLSTQVYHCRAACGPVFVSCSREAGRPLDMLSVNHRAARKRTGKTNISHHQGILQRKNTPHMYIFELWEEDGVPGRRYACCGTLSTERSRSNPVPSCYDATLLTTLQTNKLIRFKI